MSWYGGFKPYVPVAQRRAQAEREVARRLKSGQAISPVKVDGRTIASTFWGKAWCTNLEGYSDFENRLPRGRTYVRNGSVVHLTIEKGRITALVSGSSLYEIKIEIAALPKPAWQALKKACAGKVGTLVDLLRGKLAQGVMEVVTDREGGLFPKPKEISMRCNCPDYAGMCKHLAAVMYGVGNRLDTSPESLFLLRGVDHKELIEQAIPAAPTRTRGKAPLINASDLGAIFDIEIDEPAVPKARPKPAAKVVAKVKGTAATSKAKVKAKPVVKTTIEVVMPLARPKAKAAAKAPVAKATKKVAARPTAEEATPVAKAKARKATSKRS